MFGWPFQKIINNVECCDVFDSLLLCNLLCFDQIVLHSHFLRALDKKSISIHKTRVSSNSTDGFRTIKDFKSDLSFFVVVDFIVIRDFPRFASACHSF